MSDGWHVYTTEDRNRTISTTGAADEWVLIGGANPWKLLELRIFQTGTTTLTMDEIVITRGVGGVIGAGTALTERELTTSGAAATVTAGYNPDTDVGTDDYVYRIGWNLLQEGVWLPIPNLQIPVAINGDIGIALQGTTAHTACGMTATWAEYTGN